MIAHTHEFKGSAHVKITDEGAIAWPANGIHEGVPFDVYRSDDITQSDTIETVKSKAVSKSLICNFIKDPGAWKVTSRKEPTPSMGFGSLVDTLLLEESEFESRYVISPFADYRKKEAQEWKAEMALRGSQIVTESQLADAHDACEAVRNHHCAASLLDGARSQVAFRYNTKHGMASKGLIDIVPTDETVLVDLKTCAPSALEDLRSLQKHIYKFQYHIQAGSYLDGWNIASGEERTKFKFIFVTNAAPYLVAVIELPFAAILLGAEQYRSGVAQFADCLERNKWPSRWDDIVELDLPAWAYLDGGEP
jgi:hypothetical protein